MYSSIRYHHCNNGVLWGRQRVSSFSSFRCPPQKQNVWINFTFEVQKLSLHLNVACHRTRRSPSFLVEVNPLFWQLAPPPPGQARPALVSPLSICKYWQGRKAPFLTERGPVLHWYYLDSSSKFWNLFLWIPWKFWPNNVVSFFPAHLHYSHPYLIFVNFGTPLHYLGL